MEMEEGHIPSMNRADSSRKNKCWPEVGGEVGSLGKGTGVPWSWLEWALEDQSLNVQASCKLAVTHGHELLDSKSSKLF